MDRAVGINHAGRGEETGIIIAHPAEAPAGGIDHAVYVHAVCAIEQFGNRCAIDNGVTVVNGKVRIQVDLEGREEITGESVSNKVSGGILEFEQVNIERVGEISAEEFKGVSFVELE